MRSPYALPVAGLTVLLAGCAGPAGEPHPPAAAPSRTGASQLPSPPPAEPTPFPVLSARRGAVAGAQEPGPAASLAPGRHLHVTTWGSSSCPLEPRQLEAPGPSRLLVRLARRNPDAICTQDYGPTTSVVKLPALIRTEAPVVVELRREPLPGESAPPAVHQTLQPAPG